MATTVLSMPRFSSLRPRNHRKKFRGAVGRQRPRLSAVIVNYCQWEETAQLVRQLRGETCLRRGAAEIMIVDNHSPPHPLAARLRRRPGVSLRRWGRNHGYAKGVNEGCRLSRGDWLLLLNSDVSMLPGFLDRVLALADRLTLEEPRAGVIGFQLRNSDGTPQLSSGPFPTLAGTLAGLALPRAQRKYQRVQSRQLCEVPWVTGCCFLVRRDCLRQLGGFDEDFFLYYEDVDFCRRARELGWTVWYDPALWVVHHRPLHSREVPPHLRLCTRHALLTYAAKHWKPWQFHLLTGIVKIEAWFRRHWSAHQGDAAAVAQFAELELLAADLAEGRIAAARRRLDACVQSTGSGIGYRVSGIGSRVVTSETQNARHKKPISEARNPIPETRNPIPDTRYPI